jgi:hypothetical protein
LKLKGIILNTILAIFELIFLFIVSFILFVGYKSATAEPDVEPISVEERIEVAPNHYKIGNNWLKKNNYGIWEMYLEGAPYERGLIYGKLSKELCQKQERVFVDQINDLVPNKFLRQVLRLFIGFFNRNLNDHIPLEFQQEIYGISQVFSDEYDFIGPKYVRHLNYHASHDIGHALNDYSIVGCTSFAIHDDKTKEGNIIIGRNFDFYVGDEFAEEKLIVFLKPDSGFAFASYSWAGFTGVVSGLNEAGLSVTINASKSDLPTSSKTPISILTREILQYSSTIEEAIAIAKKREVFVSETIMVSSKKDDETVLIEVSPTKVGVYDSNEETLICANHYQSDVFKTDEMNLSNIKNSDSKFRFERTQKLLNDSASFGVSDVARVLRDQSGNNVDTLGMGNPRAVNQLLVHHSIIIEPKEEVLYISTHDFQLGQYIGYNLDSVFQSKQAKIIDVIAEDPFLNTPAYQLFKKYKAYKSRITKYLYFNHPLTLSEEEITDFIASNGELYITYELLGKYFIKKEEPKLALKYISIALTKNLASAQVEKELINLQQNLKSSH